MTAACVLFACGCAPSHGKETQIVAQFERIAKENEELIRTFPATVVCREEYGHLYRKEKISLEKTGYDVRKTDSVVSPYVGVFEFVVTWSFGVELPDAQSATSSEADHRSVQSKHRVIYAYQAGNWIKQAREDWDNYEGSWSTYTTEELSAKYFKEGYPYLSLFPKLFLALR